MPRNVLTKAMIDYNNWANIFPFLKPSRIQSYEETLFLNTGQQYVDNQPIGDHISEYRRDLSLTAKEDFQLFSSLNYNNSRQFQAKDIKESVQVLETARNEIKTKIVIVSKDTIITNRFHEFLGTMYSFHYANTSQNAYKMVNKLNPDLVIIDVQINCLRGFELCEKIKDNYKVCHIPIIFLIEQNTSEQIVAGYERGADVCVDKSIKMNVLNAQISRLIKNRELIREKYITHNFMIEIDSSHLSGNDEFIFRLKKSLEGNLSNYDFNVDKLASDLGMSKSKLYRKIKLLTGFSPVEFIVVFKMLKACELLTTTNSIKVVGYNLGFRNLSYFSKCFKKQIGVSPLEFRENGKIRNANGTRYQSKIA